MEASQEQARWCRTYSRDWGHQAEGLTGSQRGELVECGGLERKGCGESDWSPEKGDP